MAGRYKRDELFIALKRAGKTEEDAERILNEVDRTGAGSFLADPDIARALTLQFGGNNPHYFAKAMTGTGGLVSVVLVSRCVNPGAPWVKCYVDGVEVKTCERKAPIGGDYRCPVHKEGAQLHNGTWVCSGECHEIATSPKA